jgi:hypothetical protein
VFLYGLHESDRLGPALTSGACRSPQKGSPLACFLVRSQDSSQKFGLLQVYCFVPRFQISGMSAAAKSECLAVRFRAISVIAVLILVLVGGLLHHHENAKEAVACSYCHASVHAPVQDLARKLPTPFFKVIGTASPSSVSRCAAILPVSSTTPRAPPSATHLVLFWESCAVAA